MGIFIIAEVYVNDMEVLEMMVQELQEITSESEKVMIILGGM
jgi:uridylate kinase